MRDFGLSEEFHFGEDACYRDEFLMHTPKNLSDEEEIDDQLGNMEDLGL
jgi:hypothetical protein